MLQKIIAAAMCFFAATSASAVTVDGTAAIYGAGILGNGVSTAPVAVSLGGESIFNIAATGFTHCCGSTPNTNADGTGGLVGNGNTNINGSSGISGISAIGRQMFLAGVFIDSNNFPTFGSGPSALSYGNGDYAFTSFASVLNQAFFIGDGLTGTGSGIVQEFIAPASADTLLLGFVDGAAFTGAPRFYGDNNGSLEATVSAVLATVPTSASMSLFLTSFGVLGLLRLKAN